MTSQASYYVQQVDFSQSIQRQHLEQMLIAYSEDEMGGGKALSKSLTKRSIELLASKPYAFSFLCYQEDTPVGFANCLEALSTFSAEVVINIHDLAVVPEHRNKGLSQRLLQSIEGFARQQNACKITLEVLEGNKRARKIYQKFGFDGFSLDPDTGNALFWQKKL
ncbi:MAG: GNAT family N-acetyltransferase [Alteromonadaceae bacterium]|nr:MAG: GNAT family N-acetyltransferase [Alteromonadaceae bacterium]